MPSTVLGADPTIRTGVVGDGGVVGGYVDEAVRGQRSRYELEPEVVGGLLEGWVGGLGGDDLGLGDFGP